MFSPDFYRCETCGNVIWLIRDSSVPVVCCGSKMRKLTAGETDGAAEKHVPFVTAKEGGCHVQIGSVMHPAVHEHHIEWIAVQTENGMYFRSVRTGDEPAADFGTGDEKVIAVYAYCNLHGLWKTELQ